MHCLTLSTLGVLNTVCDAGSDEGKLTHTEVCVHLMSLFYQ